MPLTLAQIENEVDQLPQEKLESLFNYIAERRGISEHDRIWTEESEKRYLAYKEGRVTARPVTDVIKDLKARFS